MIWRRLARAGDAGEEAPEYWVTYADLLVSLLVVFALLLFMTLARMQREVTEARKTLDKNKHALAVAASAMGNGGRGLHFDPKTRTLSMDAQVLFAYASDRLSAAGDSTVRTVATRFMSTLLADSAAARQIQEIVVAGYTDTVGSYMSNLDLSQRRAFSVMRAMVETTDQLPYGASFRRLVTASGRSEMDPVYLDGIYRDDLSRRIEIRIRFRDEALLNRVLGLEGDSASDGTRLVTPGVQ